MMTTNFVPQTLVASDANVSPCRSIDVLEVRDLWHSYRRNGVDVHAVRGVSLNIKSGEWLAIMGPSGSGKSTLLHLMAALDTPTRGEIVVGGENVATMRSAQRAELRRDRIGLLFQSYNLVSDLSASQNIELPMRLAGVRRKATRARAEALLEQLGVANVADASPAALSGGQQQRVALARALANRPLVLLADEPTGALDRTATAQVLSLLCTEHEAGQTIVLVTHDHRVAAAADRVITLEDGRIVDDQSQ
jgi:putative ABC transport system ATP-binding protein